MIQLLGLFITTMSIAGLGVIIEGATSARSWLASRTRPRPSASPHATPDGGDEHDEENTIDVRK